MTVVYSKSHAGGYYIAKFFGVLLEWNHFAPHDPSDCVWIVPGTFDDRKI